MKARLPDFVRESAFFIKSFFHQLLLRPNAELRTSVDEFIQQHAPHGYVALHLRWLEGSCKERIANYHHKFVHSPKDICTLSDDFLDYVFESQGLDRTLPIIVAHDREQPKRVEQLKEKFKVIEYPEDDMLVDMLLMIKSTYFIPNPRSSVSNVVLEVRSQSLLDRGLDPQEFSLSNEQF